ncbi:hypothetical protein GWN75_00705 [candidate division KSB1 bacterium]|nr:hypothetical protein [candidate division KSB1 bacterium]NIU23098.1 hypothetical protein [candidate division KSB1 bacterium]
MHALNTKGSPNRLQGRGRCSFSWKKSSVFKSIIVVELLTGILFTQLQANELAVRNVRFYQQQDGQIIVLYDLIAQLGKEYTIILSLFASDKKVTIPLNSGAVFGDVGKDVSPGRNKEIRWDLLKDKPNGLHGHNFVFIVDAYPQKEPSQLPMLLGVLGAVGGGVTFLVLNSGSSEPSLTGPDLPGPPDLPGSL